MKRDGAYKKDQDSKTFANSLVEGVSLNRNFTVTSNIMHEDPNLSWAAKGLLGYLISRPENWKVYTWQLCKIYGGEDRGNGRDAIYKMFKELRKAGYMLYVKYQDSDGRWQHKYQYSPVPREDFQKMFPEPVKPDMVQTDQVKPDVLTSTELPSTELAKEIIIAKPPNGKPQPSAKTTMPAGGNNKSFYSCMDKCFDLSDSQKRKLLRYPEALVEKTLIYAYHPTTQISGGPIGRLKLIQHMLANPDDYKDSIEALDKPKEPKKSKKELLVGRFKNGETYNGFEFRQDDLGIGFLHPNRHHFYGIEWKKPNFETEWLKLLEKLKIDK